MPSGNQNSKDLKARLPAKSIRKWSEMEDMVHNALLVGAPLNEVIAEFHKKYGVTYPKAQRYVQMLLETLYQDSADLIRDRSRHLKIAIDRCEFLIRMAIEQDDKDFMLKVMKEQWKLLQLLNEKYSPVQINLANLSSGGPAVQPDIQPLSKTYDRLSSIDPSSLSKDLRKVIDSQAVNKDDE